MKLATEVMTGKSKFGSACAFVEMVSVSDALVDVLSDMLSKQLRIFCFRSLLLQKFLAISHTLILDV